MREPAELDAIDRSLVAALTENARTPNSKLAASVGIAESTCIARVRGLVARGVIMRFTATLNPEALGLGLEALISVNIRAGARDQIAHFLEEIKAVPQVVQVFFLGGAEDFIVHFAARETKDVRDFVTEKLSAHPAVASTRTSMVFEHHYNGVRPNEW
jgi:DNA-binding Lrp family transcriptional regulator